MVFPARIRLHDAFECSFHNNKEILFFSGFRVDLMRLSIGSDGLRKDRKI